MECVLARVRCASPSPIGLQFWACSAPWHVTGIGPSALPCNASDAPSVFGLIHCRMHAITYHSFILHGRVRGNDCTPGAVLVTLARSVFESARWGALALGPCPHQGSRYDTCFPPCRLCSWGSSACWVPGPATSLMQAHLVTCLQNVQTLTPTIFRTLPR